MKTVLAGIGIIIFIIGAGFVESLPIATLIGMVIAGLLIHPLAEEERRIRR